MTDSSFWAGHRTLITGATGLMGGFLLKRLLEEQAEIVAVVRDSVPRSLAVQEGLLQQVTTVHGTIEDIDFLRRTFAEYSIETVLHLAAQPLVGVAKLDPLSTLEVNVRGTWNVLEAARLCAVKQVVVASSDKAYGASSDLPYRETHPLQGRYPYDVSKSCADLISTMYAETYKLPVAIARCANLFGAGDLNFSRVIPGAIQSTLEGKPFVIRSDGKFVRDFLYVKDAADAYMSLAQALAGDRSLSGEAFNFGLGIRLTVAEIVAKILDLMDRRDLVPVILNQVSVEIREQYLSSDKSASRLGWSPRYSLEAGLRETVEWYKLHYAVRAGKLREEGYASSRSDKKNRRRRRDHVEAECLHCGSPLQLFRCAGQRLHAAGRCLYQGRNGPRSASGPLSTFRLSRSSARRHGAGRARHTDAQQLPLERRAELWFCEAC